MAKVFNYITINYEKDIYTPSIDMMQGDTGRGLTFSIASPIDGLDDEISNLTATLNVVKPTGETKTVTGTIESLGNDMAKVTVEPSSDLASAIDVSGLANATLVIANATQTVTSFNFKIKIKPNPFYPKPTVRKFDVTKVSRITGVQQYEHCVQSIEFVGLNYTGNMYIVLNNDTFVQDSETEGYHNTVPLTDNTFIIGQPMTFYSGVFSCQLLGETTSNGETTKFEISPIFYIEVAESIEQGEETEYPIDPNITFGIDEYIADVKEQAKSEIEATGEAVIASIPSDYSTLEQATYNAYPTQSESGDPIYFDDGADSVPVKELIVSLEPKQSGTGDPSPTNVRPIIGYDGVTIKRNGRNLCAGFAPQTYTSKGITSTVVDDGEVSSNHVTITGTSTDNNADSPNFVIRLTDEKPINLKANTAYVIRLYGVTSSPSIRVFLRTSTNSNVWYGDSTNGTWTYTPIEDVTVEKVMFRVRTSGSVCNIDGYFQIEVGSTPTEYEPYQGQEYSVTFPSSVGTVYGGSLNVTTGVLTVDRVSELLDGTKSYHYNGAWDNYPTCEIRYTPTLGRKKNGTVNVISDSYPTINNSPQGISCIHGSANNGYVYINAPNEITSDAMAKTYFGNNPTRVVYELNEPLTYQLTPTEVTTLLGSNTISSDGSMELDYRADTTMIIEKLTNAIVSLGGNV